MEAATAVTNGFDFDAMQQAIAATRRRQVFFVGGAAKSGTTWLQFLLNAHPEIRCTGEGHFANRLMPALAQTLTLHNAILASKSQAIFNHRNQQPLLTSRHSFFLATAAICLMFTQSDDTDLARIVGDKTPDNVRHFPLLATLFPQAKFIHIVRDPRDCAVSTWFHNQRISPDSFNNRWSSFDAFTDTVAKAWVINVAHGANFAAEQPARCLTIRYEDLSQDTFAIFRQVCEFLGASTGSAVIERCCAAADFANLSGGRPRGQEDRDSFFRQGLPGNWRGHFDTSSDLAFRAKVEPWLSKFRYL